MPRNDQIARLIALARALRESRRGVALSRFAELHGVSKRTLYRDVEALELAGFPIVHENGRFRLLDGTAAPPVPGVDADELLALRTLRALATGLASTSLGHGLDRLWFKLNAGAAGSPTGLADPPLAVRAPLAFDYRAHAETVRALEAAIRGRAVVELNYRALSTGTVSRREVEPGELYWDPGLETLYLIGWCRTRRDVRIFAVHRVLEARPTGSAFVPRAECRSQDALRHAFHVWREGAARTVRIEFEGEAAREVRERRWSRGRVTSRGDGPVVLELEVAGLVEVERWVLGFGEHARVLEPKDLIDRLRRHAQAIAKKYRTV